MTTKKLLLFLSLIFSTLHTCAYDFVAENIYYNILSSKDLTCEVTYDELCSGEYSGDVTIPSAVTYKGKTYSVVTIGNCAFANCPGLTSIVIPHTVTKIDYSAFWGCSNLTSIHIPNTVTTIEGGAFSHCSSLSSIIIPCSVTTIGIFAFLKCNNLTEIISLALTPQSVKFVAFEKVPTSTCTLKVPQSSVAAYKAADVWKKFGRIIPLPEVPF